MSTILNRVILAFMMLLIAAPRALRYLPAQKEK